MAVKWHQLSMAQQGLARKLFDRAAAVGVDVTTTQIGKDLGGWISRIAAAEREAAKPKTVEVTTKDAAATLGVSVRTIQRWAKAGKVVATKDQRGRWVITLPAK